MHARFQSFYFVAASLCLLVAGCGSDKIPQTQCGVNPNEKAGPGVDPGNYFYVVDGPNTAPGTAVFDGNVRTLDFNATSAVFDALGSASGAPLYVLVYLSNDPNFCADLSLQGNYQMGSTDVMVELRGLDSTGNDATVGAGSYSVVPRSLFYAPTQAGYFADVTFSARDERCDQSLAEAYADGNSGVVSLTSLSVSGPAARAVGNAALQIGTQKDAVTVNFSAAPCPGLLEILYDTQRALGCAPRP